MAEFRTKYDPFPRKIRILDSHDNVDRLSYLAPADLIRRFMSSGEEYLRNRKVAFAQGMYSQEEDFSKEDDAQALPVYAQDVVDLQRQAEASRIKFEQAVARFEQQKGALNEQNKNSQSSESSSNEDKTVVSSGSEN